VVLELEKWNGATKFSREFKLEAVKLVVERHVGFARATPRHQMAMDHATADLFD
jgi:transposase-like protein